MQFLQWQDYMLSQNFLSKWLQGLFLTQSTNTIKIGAKFSSYQAANFGNWHQIKIVVYVGYRMCSDRNASGNFQLTRSVRGLKSLRLLPFLTSFLVGVNLPVHLLEENISTRNSTPGHYICWVHAFMLVRLCIFQNISSSANRRGRLPLSRFRHRHPASG
jgi:hypothetical protein